MVRGENEPFDRDTWTPVAGCPLKRKDVEVSDFRIDGVPADAILRCPLLETCPFLKFGETQAVVNTSPNDTRMKIAQGLARLVSTNCTARINNKSF